jgi:CheY-like chemotaxis protein
VDGEPALKGVRVLLAEDGPDNVRLIAFHLRKAGATVEAVEHGGIALQRLTADGTTEGRLLAPASPSTSY